MGQRQTFESTYDIILDIRRIGDIGTHDGWPLLVPNLQKTYNNEKEALESIHIDQKAATVGVFGLFNRGKTFLLNKLAQTNLPSSRKVHTRGISFIDPKLQLNGQSLPVILVDTAGTNTPLEREYWRTKDSEMKKNILAEKKLTETLIQHVTFLICDVIIVVVNEITWPDQEFIEILRKRLLSSDKHNKTLYVVHNYSDVMTEDELFALWTQNVVSSFNGQCMSQIINTSRGKEEVVVFKQDLVEDGEIPTLHYFLAKEDSPAGQLWNLVTYEALRQQIMACNVPYKKSLQETLVLSIVDALKSCTRDPGEPVIHWRSSAPPQSPPPNTREKTKSVKRLPYGRMDIKEWKDATPTVEIPPLSPFYITCDGNLELTSTVHFNNFSLAVIPSKQRSTSFEVSHDYFLTAKGFTVIMDLPAVEQSQIKTTVDFSSESTVLHIVGQRKLFYLDYEKKDQKTIVGKKIDEHDIRTSTIRRDLQRKGGEFELKIPLPSTIEYDLSMGKEVLKDGLYVIFLPTKIAKEKNEISTDW